MSGYHELMAKYDQHVLPRDGLHLAEHAQDQATMHPIYSDSSRGCKDITDQIFLAMRGACEDMRRFSGESAKRINAEYLFTVAVAKQIDKLNFCYGEPYRIYLEMNTRGFSKDCLLPIKFGNPLKSGSAKFRRGIPKIERNGRIDVAVYQEVPNSNYPGYQPICAIELKGFNPSRSSVVKDLKRNLVYFRFTGATGRSILKSAIFAGLHTWTKTGNLAAEERKLTELRKRYKSWLAEIGCSADVETYVRTQTISLDLQGEVEDEVDYQVLNTATIHHFAGVLVEFRAKEC